MGSQVLGSESTGYWLMNIMLVPDGRSNRRSWSLIDCACAVGKFLPVDANPG